MQFENKKLISYIIPIYNCSCLISRCIESIYAAHDHSGYNNDFEIILIDDGSQDDSLKVCRQLAKEHSEIIVITQQNRGTSEARNVGINASRGTWIRFVDADDILLPYAETEILEIINNSSALVDIITFRYKIKEGRNLKVSLTPHDSFCKKIINGIEYLSIHPSMYLWDKVYNRNIISNIRFLTGTKNIEDFLFNIQVLCNAKYIYNIDNIGYLYDNSNKKSTSRNRSKRNLIKLHQDSLSIHSELLKILNDTDINNRQAIANLLNLSIAGHFYSLMRYYNIRRIKTTISYYNKIGLYPIGKCNNIRANKFITITNHPKLFIIGIRIYHIINSVRKCFHI